MSSSAVATVASLPWWLALHSRRMSVIMAPALPVRLLPLRPHAGCVQLAARCHPPMPSCGSGESQVSCNDPWALQMKLRCAGITAATASITPFNQSQVVAAFEQATLRSFLLAHTQAAHMDVCRRLPAPCQ